MEALGALSPMETARAKLQDQIGLFLSGRAKLIRLMENPSLQVQGQARGLYVVQTQLETQLQNEIMPKLQAVSQGAWEISDVLVLGGFTGQIMKQMNDVSSLERAGGGMQLVGTDYQTMAIGIPALLVVGLIGGFMFARR